MKIKILGLIIVFTTFFYAYNSFADMERRVVQTIKTDGYCPEGSKENMYWVVTEFDKNDVRLRETRRACNGNISVQKYNIKGELIDEKIIGWTPDIIVINSSIYNHKEDQGYITWDIKEFAVYEGDTVAVLSVGNIQCSEESEVYFNLYEPFIAKFSDITVPRLNSSSIKLMPNPANDVITIYASKYEFKTTAKVRIYNDLGVTIFEQENINISNGCSIDTQNFPKGAYMVSVSTPKEGFTCITRFIKK